MDWSKCVICQQVSKEDLVCPSRSRNFVEKNEAYASFVTMVGAFRDAGHPLNLTTVPTVEELVENQGKWHKNCRREVRMDRLERLIKRGTTSTSGPGPFMSTPMVSPPVPRVSRQSGTEMNSSCLFCNKPATKRKKLHQFQKVSSNCLIISY